MHNWRQLFDDRHAVRDIPERAARIERVYWRWLVGAGAVTGAGVATIAVSSTTKGVAVGLLLAVAGLVHVALIKLWAHIQLAVLRILQELRSGDGARRESVE